MRGYLVTAVCSCAWSGMINASSDCPRCKRNCNARMDDGRWETMEKLTVNPASDVARTRRREMIRLGLIVARGKMQPTTDRRSKPRGRTLHITEIGQAALDAYRKMRADAAKREIVAASVVRHGNMAPT